MTYERRQGWWFLEAWADGIRKWEAELVDARRDPSVRSVSSEYKKAPPRTVR